ncbi:uncharacterized protein SPSK_08094 [Sporothrix schenckii 1099-18]|uniref:Uncharacterized protein n=1 Tax=Sporothrix schenckii 1099-18 TaxID=1397361 RepID=A0A0F2MJM1_SPOSC|nr:uncharacterized protein SPSK_08094 [Sporothrix schenckii 1099-18]KJR89020.1 hypothetical protein SPSK_08094 [Sporothrix schenckii 1099-18]
MPAAAPRARRAAARAHGPAAPPPPPLSPAKRGRPPTANSSAPTSSPIPRTPERDTTGQAGPQQSPSKRSRTIEELTTPSMPPALSTTTTGFNGDTAAPAPLTTFIPPDVAVICGIAEAHATTATAALLIVYRADPYVGASLDTVL